MDCVEFESLLFESLEGRIASGDRHRMLQHQRACARCHELAALVEGQGAPAEAGLADDLTAQVVAITSGKPCARAQLLLADADEAPVEDDWLLTMHLESCPECTAVARAFDRMQRELPALAEPNPGERFTASVMAATVGHRRPVPARQQPRPRLLENLFRRPRIALEGAFTIAILLLIVLGLPSPSLFALPLRSVDDAWRSASAGTLSAKAGLVELNASAATLLHHAAEWGSAEARGQLQVLSSTTRGYSQRVWNGLFAPGFKEVRSLWNEMTSGAVEADTNDQERR